MNETEEETKRQNERQRKQGSLAMNGSLQFPEVAREEHGCSVYRNAETITLGGDIRRTKNLCSLSYALSHTASEGRKEERNEGVCATGNGVQGSHSCTATPRIACLGKTELLWQVEL